MPRWLKTGILARDPTFKQDAEGVWRGLVDAEDDPWKRKKAGKYAGGGFGLKTARLDIEEDAMNVEGENAVKVGVEEGEGGSSEPVVGPDGTVMVNGMKMKEKKWSLKIGFEGKGGVGVMDIEVSWRDQSNKTLMYRNAPLQLKR